MTAADANRSGLPLRDTAVLVAIALGSYWALAQDVFFGSVFTSDAYRFLRAVATGADPGGAHALYVPLNRVVAGWLEPLGVSTFRSMQAVSALGAALSVAASHRAAGCLGLERRSAAAAALLCGWTPSVVFFATIIEIPGVFVGCVAVAWWLGCRLRVRPSASRAAALGVATAVGAGVHASGHLLSIIVPVAVLAAGNGDERAARVARYVAVTVLAHGATAVLVRIGLGWPETDALGAGTLWSYAVTVGSFASLPRTLWNEGLVPLAPLSGLCLYGLLRGPRRPWAAYAVLMAGYLVLSHVLLRGVQDERGGYLMPVVFPGAVLAVRWWRPPVVAAAACAGLGIGVLLVSAHDRLVDPIDAGDALRATAAHNAILLGSGRAEIDPILRADAGAPVMRVEELYSGVTSVAGLPSACDAMHRELTRRGFAVIMTRRAMDSVAARAPALHAHLTARYALTPLEVGSFRGIVIGASP